MSRVGRLSIAIPKGVDVSIDKSNHVVVKGPKGKLEFTFQSEMTIETADDHISVTRPSDQLRHRALHGTTRSFVEQYG